MPIALLRCYVDMLPRMEAEDSARTANAIAFGFGAMGEERAREYAAALNQRAGVLPRKRASGTPQMTPQQIAASMPGVTVVVENGTQE